ncbi:hypothetical protein RHGRI_016591 [Rhododendron griersonianum]|uniref:Uncharacterized protein n=1 Tax=Rhododendron griersonianum TaxID=479676 RepID=A0AAV6JUT0_9ERIC|nr:hypothetical protein RHGRI_016591 [Rhododendron griersonianum]
MFSFLYMVVTYACNDMFIMLFAGPLNFWSGSGCMSFLKEPYIHLNAHKVNSVPIQTILGTDILPLTRSFPLAAHLELKNGVVHRWKNQAYLLKLAILRRFVNIYRKVIANIARKGVDFQLYKVRRYCSNQYPKAESYRVCNWCLIQTEKTQVSPNNSSSSNKTPSSQDHDHVIKKKKKLINGSGSDHNHGGQKGSSPFQIPVNTPIKKLIRSPEESPAAATARKRLITGGGLEGRLTRTKSQEISNGGTLTKQVFRNKVRRYKLLDEVSSQ